MDLEFGEENFSKLMHEEINYFLRYQRVNILTVRLEFLPLMCIT